MRRRHERSCNLAITLNKLGKQAEAKSLLLNSIADARRAFGDNHTLMLDLRNLLACAHARTFNESRDIEDLRMAVAIHEDIVKRTRQIFGVAHPLTKSRQAHSDVIRSAFARAQANPSNTVFIEFRRGDC